MTGSSDASVDVGFVVFDYPASAKPAAPKPANQSEQPSAGTSALRASGQHLDPYAGMYAGTRVELVMDGEKRLDLPWASTAEMTLLLEALYILGEGTWVTIGALQSAIVGALVEQVKATLASGQIKSATGGGYETLSDVHALSNDPSELAGLLEVNELLKTGVYVEKQFAGLVVDTLRRAKTTQEGKPTYAVSILGMSVDPKFGAQLFAMILEGTWLARAKLESQIQEALVRVEEDAKRLLLTTLSDCEGQIYRETIRYFGLHDNDAARAALTALNSLPVDAKNKGASAIDMRPLQSLPVPDNVDDLRVALDALVPYAQTYLDARARFDLLGHIASAPLSRKLPRVLDVSSAVATSKTELAARETSLACEVGRLGQRFPILFRIPADAIQEASVAAPDSLGGLLFRILKPCFLANQAIQRTAKDWGSDVLSPGAEPELRLAEQLRGGRHSDCIWHHKKYIDRAIQRIGSGSSLETVAAQRVQRQLGQVDLLKIAETSALPVLVMETAATMDRRRSPCTKIPSDTRCVSVS